MMTTLRGFALAIMLLSPCARAGFISADISWATDSLAGHPAAPFLLAFELTDGAGIGNSTNVVFVSQVNFGSGGSALGSAVTIGGVLGDLSNGLVFSDSQSQNQFVQAFTPGD